MADKPDKKPDKKGPPPPPAGGGLGVGEVGVFLVLILLALGAYAHYSGYVLPNVVTSTLRTLHETATLIATVVSMLALFVAIYAYIRYGEIAEAETKKLGLELNWESERTQKNARWERVENYMSSSNSSDWKIAILESDNMLDEITERMGYPGETLGERMKNIEASDFPYLEEAWTAHKMRNQIAHKGTDYEITRSDAEQTINIYHRIFRELGYL